jgi:hypothetical protein
MKFPEIEFLAGIGGFFGLDAGYIRYQALLGGVWGIMMTVEATVEFGLAERTAGLYRYRRRQFQFFLAVVASFHDFTSLDQNRIGHGMPCPYQYGRAAAVPDLSSLPPLLAEDNRKRLRFAAGVFKMVVNVLGSRY